MPKEYYFKNTDKGIYEVLSELHQVFITRTCEDFMSDEQVQEYRDMLEWLHQRILEWIPSVHFSETCVPLIENSLCKHAARVYWAAYSNYNKMMVSRSK